MHFSTNFSNSGMGLLLDGYMPVHPGGSVSDTGDTGSGYYSYGDTGDYPPTASYGSASSSDLTLALAELTRLGIDPAYCQKVRCGEISQAQAGVANLYACAVGGMVGVTGDCTLPTTTDTTAIAVTYAAPHELPYTQTHTDMPYSINSYNNPETIPDNIHDLTPMDLVAPLPTIIPNNPDIIYPTNTRSGCDTVTSFVNNNPLMALALGYLAIRALKA